jgi:hypothetical protein
MTLQNDKRKNFKEGRDMAVTLEEIGAWLDAKEVNYDVNREESTIAFGVTDGKTTSFITLKLKENGEMFQIYINNMVDKKIFLKIKGHKHMALVFQYMLKLNYDEKFGTWEADLADGEVRFAVEIPLEDALMTEKQFTRVFDHINKGGSNGFSQILQILETGEFPEEEDGSALLAMLEEFRQSLEKTDSSKEYSDEDAI